MLGSGAASLDGEVPTQSQRWDGFHGKPLTISTSMRLSVLLGRKGTIGCEPNEDTPVLTVIWAHIVPDRVMSYDLLLWRDSWDRFPVRKYRETHENETVVTFTAQDKLKAQLRVIIVSRNGLVRSRALSQDPDGKDRSNRSPSVWMQYVDSPPGTLHQTSYRTHPGLASHHRGAAQETRPPDDLV